MLIIGWLLHYSGAHFWPYFKVSKTLRAREFVCGQNADAATSLLSSLRCLVLELVFGSMFVLEADVEDEQHKRAEKQSAYQVQQLTSFAES